MNASVFLSNLTRRRWAYALFIAACLFPVLAGVIAKMSGHRWMFMDIDAVMCAGHALAAGHSPYGIEAMTPANAICPGLTPAPYVYAPQIAGALVPLIQTLGVAVVRNLYLWLVLAPATALLLWFALFKAFPSVPKPYRWLAFAALTPMTFCCGNLGIAMHALVLLSLLVSRGRKWPFVLTVLACAYLKPGFLAYFVILLMEDRPWRLCVRDFVLACLAGIAVTVLTVVEAGPLRTAWFQAMHDVTVQQQPGLGWFALAQWLGIKCGRPASLICALTYMAVMTAAGVVIVRRGSWTADERLLLGLGTAAFINPRLMDYDMVLLVPYAALLAGQALHFKDRVLRMNLSWGFVLPLAFGIIANLFHVKAYPRTHFAMLVFALLSLAVAWRFWRSAKLKAVTAQPVLPFMGRLSL